ncbi:large ribosomal subunit protein uL22 [Candidatus Tremblaya phenacola]|uniref:50S ribosomal protein L22 n=1 Tax=Candidatus Tremblayella phenacoccinincola TaxID=1010676 RepID=A0A2G0V6X5_9PROT|nr:uL22 family ribosomal protein [Candidatus Tremblaya phenacola]PHN16210.1 50S ribosomal protein L22 [Candidatus Tremblaya phenacola]
MNTKVIYRCIQMSAQKVRSLSRGLNNVSASKATDILSFHKRKAACLLKRLIQSAVQNIVYIHSTNVTNLKIKAINVDKASSRLKPSPRAKGRVNYLEKQSCHVSIIIEVS